MIGKALDKNNDLIIQNGQILTVSDAAEVVQHVRTRLYFYLEEWFLDLSSGTPWLQEIFTKPVNLANIESIFKSRIINTIGVEKLIDFSMDYEGGSSRLLTVNFSAETNFGIIQNEKVTINV